MIYKYFKPSIIRSLEELKKAYKELAKLWHPDITGRDTNKEMAQINEEYENLFEMVKNVKFNHKEKTFYENPEETKEQANDFINIINKLVKIANIEIMIIGSWLWITGNTFPIKEELKEMSFSYSKNKKAWYLHYEEFKKTSKKNLSLEEIKHIFDVQYFANEEKQLFIA